MHSGWAAAVALAGPTDRPAVVTRRRIQMVDSKATLPAQPYHAAVGLDVNEAERMIGSYAARAASLATSGLQAIVADLQALGHEVVGAGLLLASGRPLPGLETILGSHPLLHTAEGELFREALRAACRECGLPLAAVKERDLFTRAAADLHIPAMRIEEHVGAMGKAIGPPWRQDEKFAAAAAWIALVPPQA